MSIAERKTDIKHLLRYLNEIDMTLQNLYAPDIRVILQLFLLVYELLLAVNGRLIVSLMKQRTIRRAWNRFRLEKESNAYIIRVRKRPYLR